MTGLGDGRARCLEQVEDDWQSPSRARNEECSTREVRGPSLTLPSRIGRVLRYGRTVSSLVLGLTFNPLRVGRIVCIIVRLESAHTTISPEVKMKKKTTRNL